MTDADADQVLSTPPFDKIDSSKFPPKSSLRDIVKNDTRINRYLKDEIIVREGDYGNSAFLIMEGSVRVLLENIDNELLGRKTTE